MNEFNPSRRYRLTFIERIFLACAIDCDGVLEFYPVEGNKHMFRVVVRSINEEFVEIAYKLLSRFGDVYWQKSERDSFAISVFNSSSIKELCLEILPHLIIYGNTAKKIIEFEG